MWRGCFGRLLSRLMDSLVYEVMRCGIFGMRIISRQLDSFGCPCGCCWIGCTVKELIEMRRGIMLALSRRVRRQLYKI